MKTLLVLVGLMIAVPAWAQALGPVNPAVVEALAPQINADGSTLTDLASVQFCEGTSATAVLTNCVTVLAPADPPAGALVSSPMTAFTLTGDGQHYIDASAVDTAGNRSARTARVPFELNRQAPSAPGSPTFR